MLVNAAVSLLNRESPLEYLSVFDNRLTGTIPAEMAWLPGLSTLSLGANFLTGSLPTELLVSSSRLKSLWLEDNLLTGFVSLSTYGAGLPRLTSLRLSGNAELRQGPRPLMYG
jgi:Leucine-rich repeat (LRR) protein